MNLDPEKLKIVEREIAHVLNCHGIDNDLNTPDFELAKTMLNSVTEQFETFINENDHLVYVITGIEDFVKIPADRLEDCLKDLKVGTDMFRPIYDVMNKVGLAMGAESDALIQRKFMWIDDGIHGEEAAKQVSIRGIEIDGDKMQVQMSSPGAMTKKVEES